MHSGVNADRNGSGLTVRSGDVYAVKPPAALQNDNYTAIGTFTAGCGAYPVTA